MTEKEAIKRIEDHMIVHRLKESRAVYITEAFIKAIEALEKQIPMPVRVTTSTKRCGRCNRQLSGIGNIHPERSYCPGCGQAIKWEE